MYEIQVNTITEQESTKIYFNDHGRNWSVLYRPSDVSSATLV